MLASLSADPSRREVAQAVEASTTAIIEVAAAWLGSSAKVNPQAIPTEDWGPWWVLIQARRVL